MLEFSYCEKLIAEGKDSSRIRRKGNICCWKPLPKNGYWRL
jgi:hypothetical protein